MIGNFFEVDLDPTEDTLIDALAFDLTDADSIDRACDALESLYDPDRHDPKPFALAYAYLFGAHGPAYTGEPCTQVADQSYANLVDQVEYTFDPDPDNLWRAADRGARDASRALRAP